MVTRTRFDVTIYVYSMLFFSLMVTLSLSETQLSWSVRTMDFGFNTVEYIFEVLEWWVVQRLRHTTSALVVSWIL
jgi:hypothetical protein